MPLSPWCVFFFRITIGIQRLAKVQFEMKRCYALAFLARIKVVISEYLEAITSSDSREAREHAGNKFSPEPPKPGGDAEDEGLAPLPPPPCHL